MKANANAHACHVIVFFSQMIFCRSSILEGLNFPMSTYLYGGSALHVWGSMDVILTVLSENGHKYLLHLW